MTVSQRASAIYKMTKPAGGTWKEAMSQAYDEIARQEMEREEEDARDAWQSLEDTFTVSRESGILGSINDALADLIVEIQEKYIRAGYKYPYSAAKRAVDAIGGFDIFWGLMYSYETKDEWDSQFRNGDGRISSSIKARIDSIADRLGVEIRNTPGYMEMSSYFI